MGGREVTNAGLQLPQIPATHPGAPGIGRKRQPFQPFQPLPQLPVFARLPHGPALVLSEGDARGILALARMRRDRLPCLQPALPGDGTKNVAEQIGDRQHIAQRCVRTALGQVVILAQGLQFAVPGGHRSRSRCASRNAQKPALPMGAMPSRGDLDQAPSAAGHIQPPPKRNSSTSNLLDFRSIFKTESCGVQPRTQINGADRHDFVS